MVTESYMLDKPAPPSALRQAVNQRAIPALIDAAAQVERRLEHLAVATRQAPIACLAAALSGGWIAARLVSAWSRPARRDRA